MILSGNISHNDMEIISMQHFCPFCDLYIFQIRLKTNDVLDQVKKLQK